MKVATHIPAQFVDEGQDRKVFDILGFRFEQCFHYFGGWDVNSVSRNRLME